MGGGDADHGRRGLLLDPARPFSPCSPARCRGAPACAAWSPAPRPSPTSAYGPGMLDAVAEGGSFDPKASTMSAPRRVRSSFASRAGGQPGPTAHQLDRERPARPELPESHVRGRRSTPGGPDVHGGRPEARQVVALPRAGNRGCERRPRPRQHPGRAGEVLYLALEDNARRLQDRLRLLLNGEAAPDGSSPGVGVASARQRRRREAP